MAGNAPPLTMLPVKTTPPRVAGPTAADRRAVAQSKAGIIPGKGGKVAPLQKLPVHVRTAADDMAVKQRKAGIVPTGPNQGLKPPPITKLPVTPTFQPTAADKAAARKATLIRLKDSGGGTLGDLVAAVRDTVTHLPGAYAKTLPNVGRNVLGVGREAASHPSDLLGLAHPWSSPERASKSVLRFAPTMGDAYGALHSGKISEISKATLGKSLYNQLHDNPAGVLKNPKALAELGVLFSPLRSAVAIKAGVTAVAAGKSIPEALRIARAVRAASTPLLTGGSKVMRGASYSEKTLLRSPERANLHAVIDQAMGGGEGATPKQLKGIQDLKNEIDANARTAARTRGITPGEHFAGLHTVFHDTAHINPAELGPHDTLMQREWEAGTPEVKNHYNKVARSIMRTHRSTALPENAQTIPRVRDLLLTLRARAIEGEKERFWYGKSAQAFLDYTKGNKDEAVKLAKIFAIYSPRARVWDASMWNNTTRALGAYEEFKKTGAISDRWSLSKGGSHADWQTNFANNVMTGGPDWEGLKTTPFYSNFLKYLDPAAHDAEFGPQGKITIDTWMRRAFEYMRGKKGSQMSLEGVAEPLGRGAKFENITPAMYAFMSDATHQIAKELGWGGDEAQAAIWSSIKAEGEKIPLSTAGEDFQYALVHGPQRMADHAAAQDAMIPLFGKDHLGSSSPLQGLDFPAPSAKGTYDQFVKTFAAQMFGHKKLNASDIEKARGQLEHPQAAEKYGIPQDIIAKGDELRDAIPGHPADHWLFQRGSVHSPALQVMSAQEAEKLASEHPGQFLFHGTNAENAAEIRRTHILKAQSSERSSGGTPAAAWLSSNPHAAAFRGDHIVVVPRSAVEHQVTGGTLGMYSSPNDIRLTEGSQRSADSNMAQINAEAGPSPELYPKGAAAYRTLTPEQHKQYALAVDRATAHLAEVVGLQHIASHEGLGVWRGKTSHEVGLGVSVPDVITPEIRKKLDLLASLKGIVQRQGSVPWGRPLPAGATGDGIFEAVRWHPAPGTDVGAATHNLDVKAGEGLIAPIHAPDGGFYLVNFGADPATFESLTQELGATKKLSWEGSYVHDEAVRAEMGMDGIPSYQEVIKALPSGERGKVGRALKETQAEVAKLNPALFQRERPVSAGGLGPIKGAYDSAGRTIHLSRNSDLGTVYHEWLHDFLHTAIKGTPQEAEIAKWAGAIGANGLYHWTTAAEEKFVEMMFRAASTGTMPKGALRNAIAKSIQDAGTPPPPEIAAQFKRVLGGMTSADQLREGLKGARSQYGKQAVLRSQERGSRAKAVKAARLSSSDPMEAHINSLAALKGALPAIDFRGLKQLDAHAVTELMRHTQNHEGLREYQKVSLNQALNEAVAGKIPTPSDMRLFEHVFGKTTARGIADAGGRTAGDTVIQILNIPRSIMASADISAPLRQALVAGFAHPILWAKAWPTMLKSVKSEHYYEDVMARIKADPDYNAALAGRVSFTDISAHGSLGHEEQFPSEIAHHIPLLGHVIKGSERAYTAFLNDLRMELFKQQLRIARGDAHSLPFTRLKVAKDITDEKFLMDLGKVVNASTGRGTIGPKLEHIMPALNTLMFSPRLALSRLNYFNPVWYMHLSPQARVEALRGLLATVGGVSSVVWMASMIPGVRVGSLDPRSADFGKLRVGDIHVDLAGGFQQYLRIVAEMTTNMKVSSTTGKKETLGSGFGIPTRWDELQKFFVGKFAPVPAIGANIVRGTDNQGNPTTWKSIAENNFIPLVAQDAKQIYDERHGGIDGLAWAIGGYGLASTGVGVQTYGRKDPTGKMTTKLEKLTKDAGYSFKVPKAVTDELPLYKSASDSGAFDQQRSWKEKVVLLAGVLDRSKGPDWHVSRGVAHIQSENEAHNAYSQIYAQLFPQIKEYSHNMTSIIRQKKAAQ